METKIKRFYKESNVTSDISGDYLEIKMSVDMFQQIQDCLLDAWINGTDRKRAQRIRDILDKARWENKPEFY